MTRLRRRGARAATAALVLLAAAPALATPAAGPTDRPGPTEPPATPTWGVRLTSDQGDLVVTDLDTHGARTYAVGRFEPTDGSGPHYVREVRDADGRLVERSVGPEAADGDDAATIDGVDAGPWGSVVIGGTRAEMVDGQQAGDIDVWVRRYRADGAVAWTTQVGTAYNDFAHAVAVVGDRVVLPVISRTPGGETTVRSLDLATGAPTGSRVLPDAGSFYRVDVVALGGDVVLAGNGGSGGTLSRVGADDLEVEAGRAIDTPLALASDGTNLYLVESLYRRYGSLNFEDNRLVAYRADLTTRWTRSLGPVVRPADLVVHAGGPVWVGQRPDYETGAYVDVEDAWSGAGVHRWRTSLGSTAERSGGSAVVGSTPQGVVVGLTAPPGLFGADDAPAAVLANLRQAAPRAEVRTGGRYAATGAVVLRRGRPAVRTTLRVTNAGEAPDRFTLSGCTVRSSIELKITAGARDVSRAVRAGSYRTATLAPGRAVLLTVSLRAGDRSVLQATRCDLGARSVAVPGSRSTATLRYEVTK